MDMKYNLEQLLVINVDKSRSTLYTDITYTIQFENNLKGDIYNLEIPLEIPVCTKYKEDSVYLNGEHFHLQGEKSIKIGLFSHRDVVTLSYTVTINEIPLIGQIENELKVTYSNTNEEIGTVNLYSNKVATKVKGARIHIEKKINKERYYVNDVIAEEIIIRNSGNIKALNIILEIILNENILMKSMLINNNQYVDINRYKSIPIGELEAVKAINIKWQGEVIGVDTKSHSRTRVKYTYFDDYTGKYVKGNIEESDLDIEVLEICKCYEIEGLMPMVESMGEGRTMEIEKLTGSIESEVIEGDIKCEISSNKERYIIGDRASFNLNIENLGDNTLENARIKINVPKEVEILKGIIYINSVEYKYSDMIEGIDLENIKSQQVISIRYYGIIKKRNFNNLIKTYYEITGNYMFETTKEKAYKKYSSDVLINYTDEVSIKTFFMANREILLKGDQVTYTTTIINDGTLPVNIKYSLNISEGLEEIFIKEDKGLIEIIPNDGVIIEKKFICRKINGIRDIGAKGIIDLYYKEINKEKYTCKQVETDPIQIQIANSTFKELIIEEVIDISEVNPKVCEVINIYFKPTIIRDNIRTIRRNYGYNSIDVIGHKLEFIGKGVYTIEYLTSENKEEIYLISGEKTFSSGILLPEFFSIGKKIIITPKVIDMSCKIVEEENMFINIVLLINTSI